MRVRLIDKAEKRLAGEYFNFDTDEEVELLVVSGKHYSALWSLRITIDEWNGLPRIKDIETRDGYSDR
jgi:hypothetical protein